MAVNMVSKSFLVLWLLFIIWCGNFRLTVAYDWGGNEGTTSGDNTINNEWSVKTFFRELGDRAAERWKEAQHYNDFEKDWKKLKAEPFNPVVLGYFISNTTLPAVYILTMRIRSGWLSIYKVVMSFTKQKCDKLIGPNAPTHPWNLIKQNKETVSFVVFVYAVGLGIILVKLCSFGTFLGIVAGSYLTYTFGGPYLCFRGLVFITGCGWYLLDAVLTYPIQSAIVFCLIFLWSNMSPYFNPLSSFKGKTAEYRQLRGKVDKLDRKFSDLIERFASIEEILKDHKAEEE